MVHPDGPGRGDQGSRRRRRGKGGRDGRDGGPGRSRGGGGRGAQKKQNKNPAGEQENTEAKKGPVGGFLHFQGNYYFRECPELISYQKAQLFIKTQEGEDDGNGGDEKNYDVDGEYHDVVCGINVEEPTRDVEVFGCLVSLGQNQRGHARQARDTLDENCVDLESCSSFHQVLTKNHLRDVTTTMMRLKGNCDSGTTYSKRKGW